MHTARSGPAASLVWTCLLVCAIACDDEAAKCSHPLMNYAATTSGYEATLDAFVAGCSDSQEVYAGLCGTTRFLLRMTPLRHTAEFFDAADQRIGAFQDGDVVSPEDCWTFGSVPACMANPWTLTAVGKDACSHCDIALDPSLAATWTEAAVEASATTVCASGGTAWRGTCGATRYVVAAGDSTRSVWFFRQGKLTSTYETRPASSDGCWRVLRGQPPDETLCGTWAEAWHVQPNAAEKVLCGPGS